MVKYTIEILTESSVSISKITLNEDGKQVGETHRRAYLNNETEKQELKNDVPDYIYNAVMAVWTGVNDE